MPSIAAITVDDNTYGHRALTKTPAKEIIVVHQGNKIAKAQLVDLIFFDELLISCHDVIVAASHHHAART